ncbi:MAG: ATP-binding protein, partial [Chthoniobacteraceae bacterium]
TVLRKDRQGEAAHFEAFLATMEEGVLVADSRHVIRRVNPSLISMFSLRQDPVGQTVLTALRGVEIERIISATLETGRQQQADHEITQVKPVRQVAMTATLMRHGSGEPRVVLILRDMTRLRQLEEVRREFVANVSHELRTPLAIFQGYLETLIDTPDLDRAEIVEILSVLKRHSTRLNLLVEDLLILARLESRHERMKIEHIELGEFLDGAMRDWTQRSGGKKVKLAVEADEDEVEFFGDRFRLEQVISNLIDNAVKYTEPGGQVSVRGSTIESGIEIRVSDTGIGIPPADLPHIFERFYRADKARSRDQGGTGLGLSIVKHITQSHGGTVVAESTFGRGTTITVKLPLRPPHPDGSGAEPGGNLEPAVDAGEDEAKARFTP